MLWPLIDHKIEQLSQGTAMRYLSKNSMIFAKLAECIAVISQIIEGNEG
jgi:hypothetical protein